MLRVREGLLVGLLMSEAWLVQLTGAKFQRLGIRNSKFDKV